MKRAGRCKHSCISTSFDPVYLLVRLTFDAETLANGVSGIRPFRVTGILCPLIISGSVSFFQIQAKISRSIL